MARSDTPIGRGDTVTPGQAKAYPVTRPAPAAGQMLGLSVDRTGWTDADASLTVALEASLDNGKTWQHWCGLTSRGGGSGTDTWVASPPPPGALIRMAAQASGKAVQRPISFLEVK